MGIRKLASKWIRFTTFREATPLPLWAGLMLAGLFIFKYFTDNDIRDLYFALVFLFVGWYQFERLGFEQILREKELKIAELESNLDPHHPHPD